MKVNLKEIREQEERDLKGDLEFIKLLVDYMKKTPNKVWSKQQADFINSVMRSADVNPEIYMKVKKLVEKVNK